MLDQQLNKNFEKWQTMMAVHNADYVVTQAYAIFYSNLKGMGHCRGGETLNLVVTQIL